MKRVLVSLTAMLLLLVIGCSDDDPVVGSDSTGFVEETVQNIDGSFTTTVDASDTDVFAFYSFDAQDNVVSTGAWDIAFKREAIKTNGGSSMMGNGSAVAHDLGAVDFAAVALGDTTGLTWMSDEVDHAIDDWYVYNPQSHEITYNGYVFSMLDAEGDNYIKFRFDSTHNAAQGSMGIVHISYFYQATPNSSDLSGTVVETFFEVGHGAVYFDFSSGSVVTPNDPENDLTWDLKFANFEISQNSGPNGIGDCAAFQAWGEITDPSDIDAFTAQPTGAPLFSDIPGSAMTEWYTYNGETHQLSSDGNVYLVKSGGHIYVVQIESYYGEVDGAPASAHYTFMWKAL